MIKIAHVTYKHTAHLFTISESYHMYAAGTWETKKGGLGLKPLASFVV